MNKSLLAAAIAAGLMAPGIAAADVTLYGIAQAEYNVSDSDLTGVTSSQSIDDNNGRSRIGVKYSEKLGNGLKVFGKYEWRLDPSDNTTSGTAASTGAGARDHHLGLKGSWGSVSFGSHHAPYKLAGGVKWDPFAATHLQARRAGGMSGGAGIGGHNGFVRNSIQYKSPKMNGFGVQFLIAPSERENANGGTENFHEGDNDYSVAVQYKNGGWHGIFAHNRNNNTTSLASNQTKASGDEKLTKLGLRWKGNGFTVQGQYEMIKDSDRSSTGSMNAGVFSASGAANVESYHAASGGAGAGNDADILWLNAQYKAGNNIFSLSYGNTDVDISSANGNGSLDYDYWSVGMIHKFSKKTRVFGGYAQTDGDTAQGGAVGNGNDRDVWTIGMRKDF